MDIKLFAAEIAEFAYAESEKMRRAGLLPGNLIAKMRSGRVELEAYITQRLEELVNGKPDDGISLKMPAGAVEGSKGITDPGMDSIALTEEDEYKQLRDGRVWLHGSDAEKARYAELKAKFKS